MITGTIAIVLVFGGLIFFHEFGHFAVARLLGMGVKTFSLGFGPRLAGFTSGNTEYKLSAIPMGGYVQLAGEAGEKDEEFPDEELFAKRPAWQRMCVVAAGPFFNFLLAFIIFWFLLLAQGQGYYLPVAGKIIPDSPAALAGFQTNDRIQTIDNAPIDSWETMVATIQAAEGRELTIVVDRQGTPMSMQVTPRIKTFKTLTGEQVTVPVIGIERGIGTAYKPVEGLGFTTAIKQTWGNSKLVVMGFVNIVKRLIPVDSIGGPIMIAQVIHQSAQSSVFDVLLLAAIISINLAIINLLPIPVLDGGHIVYCLLEIIFRRPVSDRWKAVATRIGILFLLVLMSLVIFNDIRKLPL